MSLKQNFEDAWKEFAAQKNKYWNDATQTGFGCSSGTCWCFRRGGIIDTDEYFHAAGNYEGVLGDSTRFEKIKYNPTRVQWMDILVKWGVHVAVFAGDEYQSLWECAPERSHSLATNGTGCGLHFGHTLYNCGTGTASWDYIYRIIEPDDKAPENPPKKFTQDTIEKALSRAVEIANNDYHGYSNKVGSNLGSDFGQRDYDCGAFVSDCYRHAGVLAPGVVFEPNSPDNAWGYDTILRAAGFIRYPFDINSVKRGDILIRPGEHTEMVYAAYQTIGAHSSKDGGVPGDTYGNEISIVNMSLNWAWIYRLPVGNDSAESPSRPVLKYGSTGSDVKDLQKILNDFGASLTVDGSFGPATLSAVKSFQSSHGLAVDGSVGPLTWAALLSTDKPETEEPDYVSRWQSAAKADGLYKGDIDGSFGPLSKSASSFAIISGSRYTNLVIFWQTFLKDKGFYKGKIDGSFGPETKQAVKDAQTAYRIDSDGYIGPITSRTWLGVI